MNAKKELLDIIDKSKIKCAQIFKGEEWYDNRKTYVLKVSHTNKELTKFLESLNFNYDDGFGGQELHGIVWLKNDTWLERGEYDGSEWWEHKELPDIPIELK